MQIMGSQLCDHCNIGSPIFYCRTHSARACLPCDRLLHSVTDDSPDHSRFLLCNNCLLQTAVVQYLDKGLCHTCVSNDNVISRFLLYNASNKNNSGYSYSPPNYLDLDSSSNSSAFVGLNWGLPLVSFPLNNGDSSSSTGIIQNFDNYTKNYSDHQVPMLQPDCLGLSKDSPCLGFNGYICNKEDIENVLMNGFGGEEAELDLKEYLPADDLILNDQPFHEIHNAGTSTEILPSSTSGRPSVIHKDYNIEALANASCQDYNKNQMIGSKAKEETNNNLGIFPNNAHVQLDSFGPSQLILTDEMLPWEDQALVPEHKYDPRVRQEALKRYFAKKKKRKFGKQIRYESRKFTADTKRRMKGRFTKAGADYDYDPRANNIHKEANKMIMT